jgi:hypothetical protein
VPITGNDRLHASLVAEDWDGTQKAGRGSKMSRGLAGICYPVFLHHSPEGAAFFSRIVRRLRHVAVVLQQKPLDKITFEGLYNVFLCCPEISVERNHHSIALLLTPQHNVIRLNPGSGTKHTRPLHYIE